MSKLKVWLAKKLFKEHSSVTDAGSAVRNPEEALVKRVGLRYGDITSKDFEDPEFDLTEIQTGYNADSYIRQGVDKYVDQIFKEGHDFYGKNEAAVEYVKLRLEYMAEVTATPLQQLLTDIAEDVVKYSNCFLVKARAKDQVNLPEGANITGLNGAEPVAGYFCLNATTIKMKRDKTGLVTGYQQETPDADKPLKFKPEDIVHFYYKREKGNAFGTPFLWPVLDDVRALRQAEENVLRMMFRNIYPFTHVKVGTEQIPGTDPEVNAVKDEIDNMEVDGGLVTTNRIDIQAIASDKVIDAEPYLAYLEQRVFSGMGIPAILFGRGDTSNRSTGDNMTSEMSDRIKAIQRTIESIFNSFIMKEILLEGGFDPVLNPDDEVKFKFKENDMDSMIKYENHVIYKFEHNAITEDEMRSLLNMDPVTDRTLLNRELTTKATIETSQATAAAKATTTPISGGSKAANNKNKPQNQSGTKSSPKKNTNSSIDYKSFFLMMDEALEEGNNLGRE